MDNQGRNLHYNRRGKHLVPTYRICPQLPVQTHKFKVNRDAKKASYDIILGCNAMKKLQFNLLYSENIPKIRFEQEVKIHCKPRGFWSHLHLHQVYFQAQQSTIDKAEEEFLDEQCFSQAQYQAADLHKCLPTHLLLQQTEKLHALLEKHRFLFKGTLGLLFRNLSTSD
jgi:hypothetical protein